MAWIARQHIDISYIKPLHDQNNVFSDKDTDEEIIRSAKQENPDIKAEKAYNQLVDIKNNTAEKGGSKTYLCPICQSVFEKLFNLKSHMIRKYKMQRSRRVGIVCTYNVGINAGILVIFDNI